MSRPDPDAVWVTRFPELYAVGSVDYVASWAYYVVPVRVVGPPADPDDGEHVVEVRTLPPAKAADWLRPHDPIHADVVLLAVALGLVAG